MIAQWIRAVCLDLPEPQLCFHYLRWTHRLRQRRTFRSLCIGALRVAPVRQAATLVRRLWRRSSFASFDIDLRFRQLRSLVCRSAKHHAEVTVDHARRVFSRALKKLDTSQGRNPTLRAMIMYLLKQEPLEANSQPFGNTCQACSSSSKTLASFKSRVSKPSVNQPYSGARRSRASSRLP
jgi:hypothetical protein